MKKKKKKTPKRDIVHGGCQRMKIQAKEQQTAEKEGEIKKMYENTHTHTKLEPSREMMYICTQCTQSSHTSHPCILRYVMGCMCHEWNNIDGANWQTQKKMKKMLKKTCWSCLYIHTQAHTIHYVRSAYSLPRPNSHTRRAIFTVYVNGFFCFARSLARRTTFTIHCVIHLSCFDISMTSTLREIER